MRFHYLSCFRNVKSQSNLDRVSDPDSETNPYTETYIDSKPYVNA